MPYESKPPSVLPEDVMALMVAFEGMLPAVPVDVDAGAEAIQKGMYTPRVLLP